LPGTRGEGESPVRWRGKENQPKKNERKGERKPDGRGRKRSGKEEKGGKERILLKPSGRGKKKKKGDFQS